MVSVEVAKLGFDETYGSDAGKFFRGAEPGEAVR